MLYFNHVTCYPNRGNEGEEIVYNMNYMRHLSDQESIHHPCYNI